MTNLLQFAILNQITPWSCKPNRVSISAGWYKADLPLVIYDQNRTLKGFASALSIGMEERDETPA
jgi:hypothetical protein